MFSLESSLLRKKFAKLAVPDYEEQEAYPNLPPDVEGEWQPLNLGGFPSAGSTLADIFLSSTPTVLVDPGTDQGNGKWRARKFKIAQTIKNPETDYNHGFGHNSVLRYQGQVVTVMIEGASGGGNQFQYSNSNTQIDFHNTTAGDLDSEAVIRVSGSSLLDDPTGTFTGVADANGWALQNPWDVIHFILVCIAGIPSSRLNMASFTLSGSSKQGYSGSIVLPSWMVTPTGYGIRAYFDSQMTVQELIDVLAFSFGHKLVVGFDGIYALRPLRTYPQLTSTLHVTDGEITGWQETLRLDSFQNRIIVRYFQVPAGAQEQEFDVTKRRRKKKRKIETFETQAFHTVRPVLTKIINGLNVKDDLLYAIGKEAQSYQITTYYVLAPPAQDLANYIYKQLGRGCWEVSFTEVEGTLMNAMPGDLVVAHRSQSAHGDISSGKAYRLMDATVRLANSVTEVSRADEVK